MKLSEGEAKKEHSRVVRETRDMLFEWLLILSVNFLAHFMRMGVSLSYMTSHFKASELNAGAVVTIHLTLIGLANAYLSFSMDTHPFESMITARFAILTLATLAEWLARSFFEFAMAYILASLAVVWIAVSDAYFVQMLPSEEAKKMSAWSSLFNRAGILGGLSMGGLIGGLFSLNSVFLAGFVIAGLSLLYILLVLVGKEEGMKQSQREQIKQLYMDHPHLFAPSMRFPMPFILDDTQEEQQSSNVTRSSSVFCTAEGIPLTLFIVFMGFLTTEKIEVIAWWNVYSMQVMNRSIALSNAQVIFNQQALAELISIPALLWAVKQLKTHLLTVNQALDQGMLAFGLSGLTVGLSFLTVLPSLSFHWFWLVFAVIYIMDSLPAPYRFALQVIETPADQAGSVFACLILSRSLIPAMQHIIIGALWNRGGPSHPWFFRWFGILSLTTVMFFFLYWVTKKRQINQMKESKIAEYHSIP